MRNPKHRLIRPASLTRVLVRALTPLLVASTLLAVSQSTDTALAAGNSISTTTNVAASTGNGQCLHPSSATDPINCNAYTDKADVWLSNLPGALADGTYFFAVIAPGSQANPNDGSPGQLSTDSHTDRTFSVSGGVVTSTGTHLSENNRMQLFPFSDTPNGGGVYIAAVCSLASYPAAGGDCKYDAFKVGADTPDTAFPLQVSKDATGSYTRTYHWGITKAADKTLVQQVGGNATFNYTVGVSHDVGTVSGVTVTGTISVFNPNADAVTGVDVTDVLSDGTVCSVTGGSGATIAVGGNDFGYTCSLAGLPAGQLDNTATATWAQQTVGTATLAAGSDDFTFSAIGFTGTAVDACVQVTDSVVGALGTRCVGDANEGVPFTYPRTIPVLAGCFSYPNTATFTAGSGATGSADATVRVCGPLATGALTIGFWSNKNGQGVITGGSSTGTVCNSGTYLRTFAPFQDLSATAKCADVAKYFTTVFNNASAATMNAMLKAQMLATALNVYFTGPGSTTATQKFLPHSNLGGVTIDLTKICTNIPTCSSFVNASSSFGGATSLTVTQLLTFAGSHSNVGGSTWYGNVKSAEELAKDVFDAINNQVAFGI
ncbi:MAG: hypothetical protein JWQ32_545 [Marmoricola sp.]|nr:hypothetical protein [Marmoricola sp.]